MTTTEKEREEAHVRHPEEQRRLTEEFFDREHGVVWRLPRHIPCLAPPVPIRLRYITTIRELLLKVPGVYVKTIESSKVFGYDIGVGFSCIYPLLGTLKYRWRMGGTDIDKRVIEHVEYLIKANSEGRVGLPDVARRSGKRFTKMSQTRTPQEYIYLPFKRLFPRLPKNSIFAKLCNKDESLLQEHFKGGCKVLADEDNIYTFVMCNPPFYDIGQKVLNTSRRNDMTSLEGEYEGGELAFISRIIDESIEKPNFALLFTSMVSSKKHLSQLLSKLQMFPCQGVVTITKGLQSRYILYWSNLPI